MNKSISVATALALASSVVSTASAQTLTLSVDTKSSEGSIRAAVYSSADAFDKGKVTTGASAVATTGGTTLEIKDLAQGTYGIALFHDVNGNEKLDRSLLGAPNEPFGFSNNPVIKFSAPKFEEFQFDFDGTPMKLTITLNGG